MKLRSEKSETSGLHTKAILLMVMIILAMGLFTLSGCGMNGDSAEGSSQEENYEGSDGQSSEDSSYDENSDSDESSDDGEDNDDGEENKGSRIGDINLRDISGGGWNYLFTYKGEDYSAIYSYDNWCIYDSYKITNGWAMKKICQALIDEHPVHGSDYESYRTARDMVYEWKQHNIAHALLPDDNPWKTTTGNVDFDPEDQGKNVEELYESRTGQEFNFDDHKDDIKRYLENMFQ